MIAHAVVRIRKVGTDLQRLAPMLQAFLVLADTNQRRAQAATTRSARRFEMMAMFVQLRGDITIRCDGVSSK
jgi:hypothetical protein